MKSVVLCEGPDDLWFISYYLHKTAGWDTCDVPKDIWTNYKIATLNKKQNVVYLAKGADSIAVWSVAGKDSFECAISVIFDKFITQYPFDSISSIVIVRDRDNDLMDDILLAMGRWFPDGIKLENMVATEWRADIEGCSVSLNVRPIIIPFSEDGAIETLLINAIREKGREGEVVVEAATQYIDSLVASPDVGTSYLSHERLILKAKYAAVIAVTNPTHSTALFQDMVMACPWEQSSYVKEHFDLIVGGGTP